MKKQKSDLDWLKTKAGYLKINSIEQDLNMPQGTLKKFLDNKRSLAEHWHSAVNNWIQKFKQ